MAIVGYRFSRVTIAAVFVLLSVIALITGCRIFSGDDDEGYYPQVTATSMSGRILVPADPASIRPAKSATLRPADLAGYVGVASAEVWIEDLADNLKYHSRTNASGVYVINDVPPGPHRVITRLENGGLAVMKNRSAEINVSETPGVVPVPDMHLLVAKNIVTGQLRDADGNFLPENTILSLWGETFKVGKDGTFISPPLPKDFSSAEIQVQLPNGNGATTFSAPFVSDIVPAFVDLMVGGSQETGNHAPSVILHATQAGEISSKVSLGSSLVLTAVGSDLDASDRTMLSVTWEVTAGALIPGSSKFEKTWKAPDYQTLATITVEVKDPKGAVGVARLPILVGIDNPSQYDGARPSVTLSSEVTQVADSAAFVVGISFDELVSGFALEDISVTNGTADNFSTVTAGRNYSVQVKPQTAGAVTVAVGENLARDVAGNGNRASNVLTVTNNVAPVLTAVTAIGAVSGVPISGQTLTAGALTPVGATADYKWQVSDDGSTGWADIGGATANTYLVGLAVGKYVRVVATGNGTYGSTVNSAAVKVVTAVTAIGAVSGVPMSGQTLTAGALTPVGATVDYKWQVSDDGSTGWADIGGATENTYVVGLAVGKYVRAVATGNGNFGGVVNSAAEKIQGMPTMVSVPAGNFQRDANAANTSFVSAFSMSAHEITRAQFARFMGTDPSDTTYSSGRADPVQMTNWYHAIAFCNKLSLAEGLTPAYAVTGVDFSALTYAAIPTTNNADWNAATCNWSANGYRLPTEMEWMWAAMGAPADGQGGGTNATGYGKAFAGSDGSNSIDAYVWYSTNSSNKTHPAGTKLANELGLYDMSGNVWEWCWDRYGSYPANSNSDYRGAGTGLYRVFRGGGFGNSADYATVAYRNSYRPYYQNSAIGFRVVRPVITPLTAIGAVSGVPMSGQTLTAGALTPGYAAVNYQWQVSDNGSSGWSNIAGETANTYAVDLGKTASGQFVRVAATGKDSYSGTVYSSALNIWGDYTSANIGTLKYVPAGTFQRDATPANTSTVSGFRMAQHEVTRTQFSTIMGTDPSDTAYSNGNADPVQKANWYHAIAFCNKLSLAEGLTPVYAVSGVDFSTLTYAAIPTTSNADWNAATCNWSANGYRLPTEMEWMWAAMGADQDSQPGAMSGGVNVTGYAKTFAGSDGSKSIDAYAWYKTNSGLKTHPAGTKLANELGLYDMSGNVWEWCWDWYGSYPANSNSDYRGAGTGSYRLIRGGGFSNSADGVAVAYRSYDGPYYQINYFGFRVVRP